MIALCRKTTSKRPRALDADDASRQDAVKQLKAIKDSLELVNCALADKIGINERSIRRWLSGECLPSSIQQPKIAAALKELEDGAPTDAPKSAPINAPKTSEKLAHQAKTTSEPIYKEIKNKDAKTKKRNKAIKSSASKKKFIDYDNACASCPALKELEESAPPNASSDASLNASSAPKKATHQANTESALI